jgi:hypothetical protein
MWGPAGQGSEYDRVSAVSAAFTTRRKGEEDNDHEQKKKT